MRSPFAAARRPVHHVRMSARMDGTPSLLSRPVHRSRNGTAALEDERIVRSRRTIGEWARLLFDAARCAFRGLKGLSARTDGPLVWVTPLGALLLSVELLLFSGQVRAEPLRWTGFNLAGAEFGKLPGQAGTDYFYPSPSDVTELLLRGANVFRLPFRWERLQPHLAGALDPTEAARLKDAVAAITSKGARVIVSPHNFGRYGGETIGSPAVPTASFARFWRSLANMFRDNSLVVFGLMNEPHNMPTEDWRDAANAAIAEIRRSGASNLILVPGNAWTGGQSWMASDYGTSNSVAMAQIVDPLDHYVYEIHQYLDSDYSGIHDDCQHADIGEQSLKLLTDWLARLHRKAFLAEFGSTANGGCLQAMDTMLYFIEEHPDQWLGWTYWAAGGWWGDHPMSAQPRNGKTPPQLTTLMPHFKQP